MKTLKFSESLVPLILSGKKTTTWRVNDDKDISEGDIISLNRVTGSEFCRAKIISVKETTFGELSERDKEGHERFSSDGEMYQAYSGYYSIEIGPETNLKIVKFELL